MRVTKAAKELTVGIANRGLTNAEQNPLDENKTWWSVYWKEHENQNNVVDQYKDGKLKPSQHLRILNSTPAVLRKIGVSELPITIGKNIVDKIIGIVSTKSGERHLVPIEELRNLQIELDNPIAVFDSKNDPDSVVVLTRIVDRENNEKAVVSIKMNASRGSLSVNSISSAYGKRKGPIESWINDNYLRYINKQARKTSDGWLQLPSDSVLRARSVLTEKDFSNELLGIIRYPVAESQPPMWSKTGSDS